MSVLGHDLGTLSRQGDTITVIFERRYARPVEKVWAALTVPERISDWFATTKIDRVAVGGTMDLDFKDENYRSLGRIVICEPMRTFAWEWTELDGSKTSLVRWDLEPDGAGCKVTLTHSGLTPAEAKDVGPGWHAHLEAIEDAADAIETPWSKVREREAAIRHRYAGWANLA